MFYNLILVLLILLVLLKFYLKSTTGWCKSYVSLVGKTVIVTGGTTGIGFTTALEFAKRGAKVIITCRDRDSGLAAIQEIMQKSDNANVSAAILDLASFESVRLFAQEIKQNEKRLDILVNNAGVLGLGDERTVDGHLYVIQANYLSHFLLTNCLLKLMLRTGNARIVNVASIVAKYASHLTPDSLDQYPGMSTVYCNSKLCNILFTQELARRCEGKPITTYSLHPGVVKTKIFRHMAPILQVLFNVTGNFYFKDCVEGCQTTLHCALQKGIECYSGEHFADCIKVAPYSTARNHTLANQLWKASVKAVNLSDQDLNPTILDSSPKNYNYKL